MAKGDRKKVVPRVCIIGGKAAPGYEIAKKIIKLCHAVAETINNDTEIGDLLKLVRPLELWTCLCMQSALVAKAQCAAKHATLLYSKKVFFKKLFLQKYSQLIPAFYCNFRVSLNCFIYIVLFWCNPVQIINNLIFINLQISMFYFKTCQFIFVVAGLYSRLQCFCSWISHPR